MLGLCFLPRRYLRLRAPDGREEHLGAPPPPPALALYRCTGARSPLRREGEGCGAPLFHARDVLSKQHCWDAGAGPERAWFLNCFLPGAVADRHKRREELAQGPMVVADVHCCACGARIGWRFCRDLEPGLHNCNQVLASRLAASCVWQQRAWRGALWPCITAAAAPARNQVGRYGVVRSSISKAAGAGPSGGNTDAAGGSGGACESSGGTSASSSGASSSGHEAAEE